MSLHTETRGISISRLREMKSRGDKIACLTAYDAGFAALLETAGVDLVLVGDTLGMVIQGHATTIPVTTRDVVYHAQCVARGCRHPMRMADMPFLSYANAQQALANAARLMQQGDAQMLKLEGGDRQVDMVAEFNAHGIPVCAHLGLQPQAVHKLGGFRAQGRGDKAARHIFDTALALQDAGADMLLLECVPATLAADITARVEMPVIGIGAGGACDGQMLVLQDILGITPGRAPRFTRDFMAQANSIETAIRHYVRAVKDQQFPAAEHSF